MSNSRHAQAHGFRTARSNDLSLASFARFVSQFPNITITNSSDDYDDMEYDSYSLPQDEDLTEMVGLRFFQGRRKPNDEVPSDSFLYGLENEKQRQCILSRLCKRRCKVAHKHVYYNAYKNLRLKELRKLTLPGNVVFTPHCYPISDGYSGTVCRRMYPVNRHRVPSRVVSMDASGPENSFKRDEFVNELYDYGFGCPLNSKAKSLKLELNYAESAIEYGCRPVTEFWEPMVAERFAEVTVEPLLQEANIGFTLTYTSFETVVSTDTRKGCCRSQGRVIPLFIQSCSKDAGVQANSPHESRGRGCLNTTAWHGIVKVLLVYKEVLDTYASMCLLG